MNGENFSTKEYNEKEEERHKLVLSFCENEKVHLKPSDLV